MMIPPNKPARFCEPEVFETLYRFNARLSLQVESTMYLCVLRAPDSPTAEALVQHLQTNLYHGEVICEKEPCVYICRLLPTVRKKSSFGWMTRGNASPACRRNTCPFPRRIDNEILRTVWAVRFLCNFYAIFCGCLCKNKNKCRKAAGNYDMIDTV